MDLAQNHARNLVGNKGANAIYFDEEVSNGNSYRIHATGYACKNWSKRNSCDLSSLTNLDHHGLIMILPKEATLISK